jgi:nitrogen fixation/metabolism regulation signal transduction histidine kinase
VEGDVRERLAAAYNLDFVQIYSEEGDLRFATTRDPLVPSPTFPGPPDPSKGFIEDRERGLLAYVGYGGDPGGVSWILVVGIDLGDTFYARLDDLSGAIDTYRDLPRVISTNQRAMLLGLGGLVLGLGVVAAWVARRIAATVSRPVASLGAGMERVAEGADGVHVEPGGTNEMERLIATFNAMSAELSRSRRELSRAERVAAWREMAQRVAHEMKNALTPVAFSAHRLRKLSGAVSPEERSRFEASLQTLAEELEGLQRLAGSFSELARLPAPELAPVDLREVVGTVASDGEAPPITWSPPPSPVLADVDRTLLRQAVVNLVRNARESAGTSGHVWVRLDTGGSETRLHVEDDGPGWAPEAREEAFTPYFTTKPHGTGLGLSLVQRTMMQHGGTVELGHRPGGGARVTLHFPRKPEPALPERTSS